ncbi:unnamed protein product [Ilex paraguariensis]|uniref:Survival Motor Neuron Gemin2-binding domain-containing protein n=1 Tax=Ilex paraguariensis TaxID=185542 RepID=A0ABC8S8P1_9AQUA
MGKEGDLWDDSALINAFDDAISKYKKMHSTRGHNSSVEGGKGVSSKEQNLSELVDENHGAKRCASSFALEHSSFVQSLHAEYSKGG